jgi:hypothetical protein
MFRALAACVIVMAFARAAASRPEVKVTYSEKLDSECSTVAGPAIKDEWKAELAQKRIEFERRWTDVGPRLLAAAERLTGRPFTATSITARLTLCNVPSENSGTSILVNMRYALASFTAEPVSVRYKVNILFHEVLHSFVHDYVPKSSPLLAEHGDESERVQDHLHLLALMKAVLLDQGLQSDLAEVIKIDSELPGGYYKRAWEIVNQTDDTYLSYVSELRGEGPKGTPPPSRTGMVGNPPPPKPEKWNHDPGSESRESPWAR